MSDFRKLEVYNKAIDFIELIYTATKKFPEDEKFVLVSQIRKAAISIALNIAEGSSRYSNRDFIHFLRISLGSNYECISLIDLSKKFLYITEKEYQQLTSLCSEVGKMLNGLISSMQRDKGMTKH